MGYDYIPKYIRQSETKRPKDVITAARWNELFNLLIEQGDYTAEELGKILGYLSSATEDHIDDSTVHVTTADKTAWNGKLDKTGGTVSGDLTVQGNLMLGDCGLAESNTNTISLVGEHEDDNVRLSNLDSPTNDNDAANKKYVDEHAGGGIAVWGGISGTLADQTDLKNALDGKLSTSGGTVMGDIRMGTTVATRGKITMLADPTTNYDAANKKYVDEHAVSGADNTFVVTLSEIDDVITSDKTFAEIKAAKLANKVVIADFFGTTLYAEYSAALADIVSFTGQYVLLDDVTLIHGFIDSSDVWHMKSFDIALKSDPPLVVTGVFYDGTETIGASAASHTFAEILAAHQAGRAVFLCVDTDEAVESFQLPLLCYNDDVLVFGGLDKLDYTGDGHSNIYISVDEDDAWYVGYDDYAKKNELTGYRTAAAQDTIDSGKVDKVNGAANGSLVYFDSNGGIKSSGKNVVSALGNNDYTVPTSKAVKDYVDAHSGGADNTFVVTGSYDGLQFGTFSATYAQIIAAYVAGKIVELHLASDEGGTEWVLPMGGISAEGFAAFSAPDAIRYEIGHSGNIEVKVTTTDEWSFEYIDYALKDDLPQNVSELTNDSGYLTLSTLPIYDGGVE